VFTIEHYCITFVHFFKRIYKIKLHLNARFVFEKFTEDSDPIRDLGIGAFKVGDFVQFIGRCDIIGNKKYPNPSFKGQSTSAGYWRADIDFSGEIEFKNLIGKILKIKYYNNKLELWIVILFTRKSYVYGYDRAKKVINYTEIKDFVKNNYQILVGIESVNNWKNLIKKVDINELSNESINEKFTEDSDPIKDMGIGMRRMISKWMKEIGEEDTDDNALAESAARGKLDFVKYLVNQGANIHAYKSYAFTISSQNGHLEIVKYLLSKGADIGADKGYALVGASGRGHLEIVKYLVSKGADIHANKDNALRWASREGQLEVVKYLLAQGADVQAKNNEALYYANQNGHMKIVKLLLDAGAKKRRPQRKSKSWPWG